MERLASHTQTPQAEHFYCDGIRSVAHTGEVLPHSNGEVMLTVVGVGPVWTGFSPSCTHSFITSAALRNKRDHSIGFTDPGFVVDCGMGSTLQPLGTITLPVLVRKGYGARSESPTHQDICSPVNLDDDEGGGQQSHVSVDFVVVEGRARECMLDSRAFTRLGLSQHDLVCPARQPIDPAATFQQACIVIHRATSNDTNPGYYTLSKGAPPPRFIFGIGHTVVRMVKGVLVMVEQNEVTGEPSLIAHQVLDGPGQNVLMQSMSSRFSSTAHAWKQDVDRVEAVLAIIGQVARDDDGRGAVAPEPSELPARAPSQLGAADGSSGVISRDTGLQGGSPRGPGVWHRGLKRGLPPNRHHYMAGSNKRTNTGQSTSRVHTQAHSTWNEEKDTMNRLSRLGWWV